MKARRRRWQANHYTKKAISSLETSDAARHGRPSLHSLQAAKMNGVDPLAWLSQALMRIANRWPASDLELPMPWNFKPDTIIPWADE